MRQKTSDKNALNSILFIDDEPDTLTRLHYIFKNDYSCHFAKTGKDGLKLFNRIKPPLVVCDVNLPDLSGFQICLELKNSNPDLRLILLSAYNDKQSRLEGLESYANSYIDKSLSDKEIFLRVRNLHPNMIETNKLANKKTECNQKPCIEDDLHDAFTEIYSKFLPKTKAIQIEDIASILSLSIRTLQRRITDETTSTFQELHTIFKLNEAKQRLQQGYTPTEIAERLGFCSPSHFSSCFKKEFNMTPSVYIRVFKVS